MDFDLGDIFEGIFDLIGSILTSPTFWWIVMWLCTFGAGTVLGAYIW